MSELINKQSALDLVRDKCHEILDRCDKHYDVDVEDYVYDDPAIFNTILTCNKEIRNALSEMPTIDAEPVRHGKWIEKSTGGEHFYCCSECGYVEWDPPNNYCSNCGARMYEE